MKRLQAVPAEVLEQIKNEQDREKETLFEVYHHYCTLPIRPVRMRILRTLSGTEQLEQVIVPATDVFLRPNSFFGTDHINRNGITYSISGVKKPFPYGHIYQGSGHVCLGNIFVPSKIPKNSPQQPLETLFLHNDRNLNHGNAVLELTAEQIREIQQLLCTNDVVLSEDANVSLKPKHNMLKDDGIWIVSADICREKELLKAINLMEKVYQIIFAERKTK